jgi:hypothetical protein
MGKVGQVWKVVVLFCSYPLVIAEGLEMKRETWIRLDWKENGLMDGWSPLLWNQLNYNYILEPLLVDLA